MFCAPGNAGIASLATCVPIAAHDIQALKDFVVRNHIDLTVVGPEVPLALGITDEFRKHRLKIFGPTRSAARIEASKSFSKELMQQAGILTARANSFTDATSALAYADQHPLPMVIKADGLAQGKGVMIAATRQEARGAIIDCMEKVVFGEAGKEVLIEEYLAGEELTIMAFTDGRTIVPMPPAQDHKRVGDGDTGLNTGGMGAYAPAPLGTAELCEQVRQHVLEPIIAHLSKIGSPFQGVLYAGLMVVKGVPYVLEFNARMGDPETQVVLPLLKTDLIEVIEAVVEHRLDQIDVEWTKDAAVCVVMTSGGYPGPYRSGVPIRGLTNSPTADAVIFHAGTAFDQQAIVTAGGRVLGITGMGPDIASAQQTAYRAAHTLSFEGCHYRRDIPHRALHPLRLVE